MLVAFTYPTSCCLAAGVMAVSTWSWTLAVVPAAVLTTAQRAPTRTALSISCLVIRSRPYSKIPNRNSRKIDRTNADSTMVAAGRGRRGARRMSVSPGSQELGMVLSTVNGLSFMQDQSAEPYRLVLLL